MARKLTGVGEDGLAADLAVVREVHVGHHPILVAQARGPGILRRAAVDGDVFADRIVVANLDPGRLARVLLVLRRRADRGEMPDAVAPPDARMAVEHHVSADPAALPHFDVLADHRIRANLDIRREARAAMHERVGMNLHCLTSRLPAAPSRGS